ncbi:MAG TPA: hypothetical protein VMT71_07365 [Syntrophorhabdales bacterium]|nr:hypothetical protein [Syntrophorhabdales bacterium]
MTYEYSIEFFSMERANVAESISEEEGSKVYSCGSEGECTVKDLLEEQMDLLQDFLNEMGSKGWELVQVLFNRNGAVSFWKRAIVEVKL